MIGPKFSTMVIKLKNLPWSGDSPFALSPVGIGGLLLLGLAAALVQGRSSEKTPSLPPAPPESMDTMIPETQSLVPIRVANYEALDQVMGRFGVVDLYSTPLDPQEKAKRIAFAVKLIRSSRSPGHFSVLVPGDEAYRLAGFQGAFTAVVRNPKLMGTQFVGKKPQRKRKVIYHVEGK